MADNSTTSIKITYDTGFPQNPIFRTAANINEPDFSMHNFNVPRENPFIVNPSNFNIPNFDEVFFFFCLETDKNDIGKIYVHYEDERVPKYLNTGGPYRFDKSINNLIYASKTIRLQCNLVSFIQNNKSVLDIISRAICMNNDGGYFDTFIYRMRVPKY
jgi:hypothetical protein